MVPVEVGHALEHVGVCRNAFERVGVFGPPGGTHEFKAMKSLKHERPYANELIGAHSTGPVMGGADWICKKPEHWIYAGTGMKAGDRIPGLIGWEWHGDPADIPGLEIVASGATEKGGGKPNGGTYTATVYPGGCLIEGTNLSEGRGTTRPFEIMGAPWVDGEKLARALREEDLPGVVFRPLCFEPTFHKFKGQLCGGIQQHVVDRDAYLPLRTGYALLCAVRKLWPREFAWRPPPYEYELERPAIEILSGNSKIREQIDNAVPLVDIENAWQVDLARFEKVRERYLIYD